MFRLLTVVLAGLLVAGQATAQELPRTHLKILGSLAGIRLYKDFEEPFWTKRIPALSHGRVTAEIAPFDESGVKPREMVQMLRLGVIPFGVILLSPASPEDPEVLASDLAGMNPTAADLRETSRAFALRLAHLYRERHGIEVLATFAYPAQVVFCVKPLAGLADLKGRTVRVSSVTQFDFIQAVGGNPVGTAFSQIPDALRKNVVECVITGSLSGNEIGLHKLTTHVHDMAFSWGVSVFAANAEMWDALDPAIRDWLFTQLEWLQDKAWDAAAADTEQGLACNAGRADCTVGDRGRMTIVRTSPEDEALRRRVFRETVLPRWLQRCGAGCERLWRESMEPVLAARTH